MDADEDEYEAEESAPAQVVTSPEQAMARALPQPRGAESAAHPRALDDMDLSWGTGFSEDIFNEGEPAESENMEAEVDAADFDHSMDGDDKESDDDDDGHDEQDHSATELVNVSKLRDKWRDWMSLPWSSMNSGGRLRLRGPQRAPEAPVGAGRRVDMNANPYRPSSH